MTTALRSALNQPKVSSYSFPQVSHPLGEGERGIASITHGQRTFRFRTNPNEFTWTYTLNKNVEQTYGGRVVQLLSTKIDDFTIKADCGSGRWPYMNRVAKFLRDIMVDQRDGRPAVFEYTKRGWKLHVYVVSVPFADAVEEVKREFDVSFKVQEDVSGTMSRNSLSAELWRLQDGIGFRRNQYNDPRVNVGTMSQEQGMFDTNVINTVSGIVGDTASALQGILGYSDTAFGPTYQGMGIGSSTAPAPPNPNQGLGGLMSALGFGF